MPELPEVETVRRDLAQVLLRERILAIHGGGAGALRKIRGALVKDIRRRGKYLLLDLSGSELVIHLGMSGRLLVAQTVPVTPHVRTVFDFSNGLHLVFVDRRRFGRIGLVPAGRYERFPTLMAMGPEPLTPDFERSTFERQLARAKAPIKAVLLNQRVVAGIGNIYADEVLYRARLHPSRRDLRPEETKQLFQSIRSVLRSAVLHRGTSFSLHRDGLLPPGQFGPLLRVFRRADEPCRNCAAPIAKTRVAARTTYFCPNCQAAPKT